MESSKDTARANLLKIFKTCQDPIALLSLSQLLGDSQVLTKSKPDLIFGLEEDQKLHKKFLKTKFNQEKESFRSPFTQIYYPLNQRLYLSEEEQLNERKLNLYLDSYFRRFFENFICSLFYQSEGKSGELYFIGCVSEGSSKNEVFQSEFKYQIECQIRINKGYLDSQGIYLECQACLKTNL